jgi:hypothetical protein
MVDIHWVIHDREFASCSRGCACPCRFNALSAYGHCSAIVGAEIDQRHHGATELHLCQDGIIP